MHSTVSATEWKGKESTGKHWQGHQGEMPFLAEVQPPALADMQFITRASAEGALRYAIQRCGEDQYEIADDLNISHGYMSKVLKGTAGLYGKRLVAFMRRTGSLAPLQWLADQMGCDIVPRDSRAARIRELEQQLEEAKRAA
jgi:hypothetical protein